MRSFIAIELPGKTKSALAAFQEELKTINADVRWVRPEGIHLTLKFLGAISEEKAGEIIGCLEGTCRKSFSFTVSLYDVGVFPNVKKPRVLWVGVRNDEAIEMLYRKIEEAMHDLGFRNEERSFLPHLTIGRFRSYRRKKELLEKINEHKGIDFGYVHVNSLSLMKSELRPGGAVYTRLAEINFETAQK